jgi:hypothetical protein
MFCTCSPSSLGQDPIVESAKEIKFKFIWASSSGNGSFEVVFEKKRVKLAPGTCWRPTCLRTVHWSLLDWCPTYSHPCSFPHAPVVVPVGAERTCVDSHLRLPTTMSASNNKKSYRSKVNLEQ